MRSIGKLQDELQARTLGDFLYAKGIGNEVEEARDGGWTVWVHSEDQLTEAAEWFTKFQAHPEDALFMAAGPEAEAKRRSDEQLEKQRASLYKDRRQLWPQYGTWRSAPLTMVLIGISVLVGVVSFMGDNLEPVRFLYISHYMAGAGQPWWTGLVEVRHGQVWRLITPIFLHFNLLHILFNLLWLRDLGGALEPRIGTLKLMVMVLSIAAVSNVAQYAISGPSFGGMSGIVYALLGYIWIKGKLDPGAGMALHPSTVTMMLAWFVLGFTGMLHIANTVHAVGLGMGMAWAGVESWRRR